PVARPTTPHYLPEHLRVSYTLTFDGLNHSQVLTVLLGTPVVHVRFHHIMSKIPFINCQLLLCFWDLNFTVILMDAIQRIFGAVERFKSLVNCGPESESCADLATR